MRDVLRELWAADPTACVLLAVLVLFVIGVAWAAVRGLLRDRPPTGADAGDGWHAL